jgi:hypothetical protein
MDEKLIAQVLRETHPGSGDRVLVAVMNNPRDFAIARDRGWYRIPVKRAPRRVGADYLAFYFTGAFPGDQRHRVVYYAPIRAYRLATRATLLPEETDHPRAQEAYFKVEIGPLRELARPIASHKLRRITFIATTLARLLNAQEVNDLWDKGSYQDELWAALQAHEIEAERQVEIQEAGVRYVADFLIACPGGPVIVMCDAVQQVSGANVLHFTAQELAQSTAACVRRIREMMALAERRALG